MARYLTSDWHFNHENLITTHKTRSRFKNKEEMNDTIINSINNVVKAEDELFFLGDMSMGTTPEEMLDFLKRIKCRIVLIAGNHDNGRMIRYLKRNNFKFANKDKLEFHAVGTMITYNKKQYILTHYPLMTGGHRVNIRNFCGHIHEYPTEAPNMLNVGVDSPEIPQDVPFGTPILFEDAVRLIEEKWNNNRIYLT